MYASHSLSHAILEILVHLGRAAVLSSYDAYALTFHDDLVTRVERAGLPRAWWEFPAPIELRRIGDEWLTTARSAVLEVPSAVVDAERTYILNPSHPDYRDVAISGPTAVRWDARLGGE